jgi:hypothetical protein
MSKRIKLIGKLRVSLNNLSRYCGDLIVEGFSYRISPGMTGIGIPKKIFELWPKKVAPLITIECSAEVYEIGLNKWIQNVRNIKLTRKD